MTPDDAKQLLARCAAFDNRQPSLIAAQGWAAALNDIPADEDAFAAVARYYSTPGRPGERLWIQPADVRTHRKAIRDERLVGFQYEPQDGDDDPRRYLANLRAQREAVASGRRAASPARELAGGPHPAVAKQLSRMADVDSLKNFGRSVPAVDVNERPERRGPLTVVCPKCTAPVGRRCRAPGVGDKRGRERPPHAARSLAARGLPLTDQAAEQQEIERRRERSRLHLAEHGQTPTEGSSS